MAKPATTTDLGRLPFHRLSDIEILLFISRALQPHLDGTGAPNVFAKLQRVKDILAQQRTALRHGPQAPGDDGICDALANAEDIVVQIGTDLAGAARPHSAAADAQTA